MLSAGLGGAGAFWQPQMAALEQHFRVVTYDQRGTGANTETLPATYTIGDMADDVIGILDQAGIARAHFMGHALGGLVGLELALRAPARLNRLVLVNAWDKVDAHTRRCFALRIAALEHGGPEAYVRAQPIFLYPAAWLARNEAAVAREEAHGIAHFQGRDTLMKRLAALQSFDASTRLGQIAAPTLVMASRDDVLVPYLRSEALAAGIPNTTLWLAAEGGHSFCATNPTPFNEAVIRFLQAPN